MGKRKSSAPKAPKKVLPKLQKEFTCPFCGHAKSVGCSLDFELKIGQATCAVSEESYTTSIHLLTEPIDVYSEWIDECQKCNDVKEEEEEFPSKCRSVSRIKCY